jgi:hypothetical protein
MDMRSVYYVFHTEWSDDRGLFFAQRYDFKQASEARNAHNGSLRFLWAEGKQNPSVSALYAITVDTDEKTGRAKIYGRDLIQEGQSLNFREPAV